MLRILKVILVTSDASLQLKWRLHVGVWVGLHVGLRVGIRESLLGSVFFACRNPVRFGHNIALRDVSVWCVGRVLCAACSALCAVCGVRCDVCCVTCAVFCVL